MKAAQYIRAYTEPFAAEENAAVSKPERLPFLPRERYYSGHEPAHYMYNFTMDNLNRDELMRVIEAVGVGLPEQITPGQLLGWIHDKDRIIDEQGALLIDRERRLEVQESIIQSRSYRLYTVLLLPARGARSLWRYAIGRRRR